MYKSLKSIFKAAAAVAVLSAGLITTAQVQAGTIVQCGTATVCSSDFNITFNGMSAGGGELLYDAETGDIVLNTDPGSINGGMVTSGGGIMWDMGNGDTVSVGSLSGNADPILGFGLGASTGSTGSTFGFTFNLPIALSGPILANSSINYTLSTTGDVGASISPVTGSNILSAFEVDTSGLPPLPAFNKGVDAGDAFFFTGGPDTQPSPVYTASNTFTGNLAYDLMTVKVDFALSADTNVGISGFVQQTVVPVPAAVWLFGSGLLALVGIARRKVS